MDSVSTSILDAQTKHTSAVIILNATTAWTAAAVSPKGNAYHQEKIRGQRGTIRALAGICRFH